MNIATSPVLSERGGAGVKSALRTLQILEVFAEVQQPLTLSELARRLGVPKSSCLALLDTLQARGYLYRAGSGGSGGSGYYPTQRWLGHARRIAEHDPVATQVHATLVRLRDRIGETAIDAVLAADQSVYLDVVESTELIRFSARIGDVKPLHSSASGRAQLGALAKPACATVLSRLTLESSPSPAGRRVDSATAVQRRRSALARLVADERQRGWSANLGEHRPDVISVAAGLELGGTVHALVIAAPYHRVEARVDEIGALLHLEAQALLQLLS